MDGALIGHGISTAKAFRVRNCRKLALPLILVCILLCRSDGSPQTTTAFPASSKTPFLASITVAADGSAEFRSLQKALDALPEIGGVIHVRPGIYRELVTINKPKVSLEGTSDDPSKTVIVFNNSHGTVGGTLKSATVSILGDDFLAERLTFANDFSVGKELAPEGSQAVALLVRGDRAVFRRVRLLGAQDTLFAGSKSCASEQGPCVPARQYFSDCYIEGNVDFIFGDAKAFFQNCEIHAIPHPLIFLTAQSKHYSDQPSGFVFDHCKVTADVDAPGIFLGRPWRPYSTVVFLNTDIQASLEPAGWREWHPGETHSLDTAFYAEYDSSGRGAAPKRRDSRAKLLTAEQARRYSVHEFLFGEDGWNPLNRR